MPDELETDLPTTSPLLVRASDGAVVDRSVFAPVYRADFNGDEAEFACYLDEQKAIEWWHRNVARGDNYFIQGWRRNRVYPDFVFTRRPSDSGFRIAIWEMKGDQLEGNLDTTYKRKLIEMMSQNYRFEAVRKAGELELVIDEKTTVTCDLVLMSEWKMKAPESRSKFVNRF